MPELAKWESFYVLVGSAAGALIGLQFVVMTLIAGRPRPSSAATGAAYATPTIVHFSVALFLAALLLAPWKVMTTLATLYGIMGLGGFVYAIVTARRMQAQTTYKPEFEDWLFHALLPILAYAVLGLSAIATPNYTHEALFGVGGSAMSLIFIGIHNTWDSLAFHVFVNRPKQTPEN